MNRLVALALGTDGEVSDEVARRILRELTRSELKRFLAALRRELKRRVVRVSIAGEAGPSLESTVGRTFPGRALHVQKDNGLGAGVKVAAGDDIVDASVNGYIREIIEELGGA